jgi:hypothetical protein
MNPFLETGSQPHFMEGIHIIVVCSLSAPMPMLTPRSIILGMGAIPEARYRLAVGQCTTWAPRCAIRFIPGRLREHNEQEASWGDQADGIQVRHTRTLFNEYHISAI